MKYKFVRFEVESEEVIEKALNALAEKGWRVVSHSEYKDEYSFVLTRDN